VKWLSERCAVQVLTFDFHNTLANCDPWFALEVRDLPWAVIEHLRLSDSEYDKDRVTEAYRQLRLDVIASGREIDAYDSAVHIFDRFDIPSSRTEIERTVDDLMALAVEAMEPAPGAIDTVRHLHSTGVRLGVVSSAVHHQTVAGILGRMGIASCFDAVVTSASSGYYKSSPAIYATALRELGGTAHGSVHVGDSLKWDVEMAQRAGMTAVWLRTPNRDVFSSANHNPSATLILPSMERAGPALVGLLERLRTSANA
jgi:HAD superfamily hydrolase (TIGR01509 family)